MISCADYTVMDVIEVNDTKSEGTWLTRTGNFSLELIAWSDSEQWMHIEYHRHIILCYLTSQLYGPYSCGMWEKIMSKGNTLSSTFVFRDSFFCVVYYMPGILLIFFISIALSQYFLSFSLWLYISESFSWLRNPESVSCDKILWTLRNRETLILYVMT